MNLVSGRTGHVLLQTTGMKSRVYLATNRAFLSDLAQVNMIGYCHMVSTTLKNFIVAAEI